MSARPARRDEAALLSDLREGRPLPSRSARRLVFLLALPTALAELSSIAMEYIDAAMVGRLGATGAAAIGLVASSTWLFWGLMRAANTGFCVQVAQEIGARRYASARSILKQGLVASVVISLALGILGAAISKALPRWLGGDPSLFHDASAYFFVFMLFGMPATAMRLLGSRMLQAAGEMRSAGLFNVLACALDVLFNFLFIFPSREISVVGLSVVLPGLGLGVMGAALGTVVSDLVSGAAVCWALFVRQPILRFRRGEKLRLQPRVFLEAFRIGVPVAFESGLMTGAMVVSTAIVAPLGAVALAANSFAITAESLCYMPVYGIGAAASTLVGQAIGAGRAALARSFAKTCTEMGVATMTATGVLLFVFAPQIMGVLSPDMEVSRLGAHVLRIEAFAEPMFAASIVASGALRGAGDTLVPSLLNFASMWGVRLPLSAVTAPRFGIAGAWAAMAFELCVRGVLLLLRLASPRWTRTALSRVSDGSKGSAAVDERKART